MKQKRKYTLLIIKILLVITIFPTFSILYALYNDKKIEDLYDKVEIIKEEHERLDFLFKADNITYGNLLVYVKQANILYKQENNDIKEYNFCARMKIIADRNRTFRGFFEEFDKMRWSDVTYPYVEKYEIEEKKKVFFSYYNSMKDIDVYKDCYLEEKFKYIINSAKTLTGHRNTIRHMLLDIKSDVFKEEKDLYKNINALSSKSSNIYLLSYMLIILISFIIVCLDLKTTRGTDEK